MYNLVVKEEDQHKELFNKEIFNYQTSPEGGVGTRETAGFEFELHPYLEISITRSHIP